MKKLVYQGIEGSFSHLTAKRLYQDSCHIQGLPTFKEAFEAVEKGEADLALLPIENTLAGTIYETIDLLHRGSLHIVGETMTPIEHSLLGTSKSSMQTIQRVFSHPKALAQCTQFFEKQVHMDAAAHYDTAGAALDISKAKDPSLGAIAHRSAAQLYGLKVLVEGIQDHTENMTRFVLISKKKVRGNKCSLCFTLEHLPGKLSSVLSFLKEHDVNLSYIVSRPLFQKPFEYMFYLDLEVKNEAFTEGLKQKTTSLKILGSYDVIS